MYRSMRADCMMDMQIAMSQAKRAGHDIDAVPYGYALIDESRNACVAKYSDGADFVLFMDDDMKPEPEAINKIIALNAPIASAICTTRTEPTDLVLLEWVDERGGFVKCHTIPMHKPVTKRFGVGGAFLCIRKDALERIKEYYLSAQDWIDWHKPEHDRMHVRKEKREEERKHKERLRRENFEKSQYLRIFERDPMPNEKRCGEDIGFSWRALQLGIPITVDGRIRVAHSGYKDYTPDDYVPEEFNPLLKTA